MLKDTYVCIGSESRDALCGLGRAMLRVSLHDRIRNGYGNLPKS